MTKTIATPNEAEATTIDLTNASIGDITLAEVRFESGALLQIGDKERFGLPVEAGGVSPYVWRLLNANGELIDGGKCETCIDVLDAVRIGISKAAEAYESAKAAS